MWEGETDMSEQVRHGQVILDERKSLVNTKGL